MNQEQRLAFIFVHNGKTDKYSRTLIEKINKYPKNITQNITMYEVNDYISDWLSCNTKNITIDRYPVFLISNGKDTKIYPPSDLDFVINMLSNLIN